jgi:hypothetical protein
MSDGPPAQVITLSIGMAVIDFGLFQSSTPLLGVADFGAHTARKIPSDIVEV